MAELEPDENGEVTVYVPEIGRDVVIPPELPGALERMCELDTPYGRYARSMRNLLRL